MKKIMTPVPQGSVPFDPEWMAIVNIYGWEGGHQREFVVPVPHGRILVDASPRSGGCQPSVKYCPYSEYVHNLTSYREAPPVLTEWYEDGTGKLFVAPVLEY